MRSVKRRMSRKGSRSMIVWTTNIQLQPMNSPNSIRISADWNQSFSRAAVEHELQRADGDRQHGEAEEIETAEAADRVRHEEHDAENAPAPRSAR